MLWSYRTTSRTSTDASAFKLTFGTEALTPIGIGSPSFRVINYDGDANTQGLKTNLDLIDEVRNEAVMKMDKYKEKTREYFGKRQRHQISETQEN